MKYIYISISVLFVFLKSFGATPKQFLLKSPDSNVKIIIDCFDTKISLSVYKYDRLIISEVEIGIVVDSINIGENAKTEGEITTATINERYFQFGNHSQTINNCNQLTIPLESNTIHYKLAVKCYNDGFALRYLIETPKKAKVNYENTSIFFNDSIVCFWALYNGEELHHRSSFQKIPEGTSIQAPLTLKTEHVYLSLSEADCRNFPDVAWKKEKNKLKVNFPASPAGWEVDSGMIISPWRTVVIADNLDQLVNSDLIMNLCETPDTNKDYSWVKPGRVLWQWWSVGEPKYEDQKKWYDAAARLTWEYYLIDDGWRFWKQNSKDEWACLKEVIGYGDSIGVKTIVWVDSKEMPTYDKIGSYLDKVKQAGAVGIKIDFIPPATPEIIQWYITVLEETYKHQLLCNFHGCAKPTGLRRTWPHELTREGVRGNEYQMIRYDRIPPKSQDVIIPFTRLISGPADFTPVIFDKRELLDFTWSHEIAQAVVYLSPLTHFADAYYRYINNPAEDLLRDIPVTWDETLVLPCSEIGELAAFARRKGDEWWIGIMNGADSTSISFNLNFLAHPALATILSDRSDAFDAFIRSQQIVYATDEFNICLKSGGGYFMRLKMIENHKR